MRNPYSKSNSTVRMASIAITALWLILFYLSSIWLVLGTMTARQAQDKIFRYVEQKLGETFSLMEITEITEQLDKYKNGLKKTQLSLENTEAKLKKQLDKRLEIYKQLSSLQTKSGSILETIEQLAASKGISISLEELDTQNESNNTIVVEDSELQAHLDEYRKIEEKQSDLERQIENIEINLVHTKELASFYRTESMDLFSARKTILSRNSKLTPFLKDFNYLKNMHAYFLAIMPDQLLTLIITMSMGALGSVIYLTRTFLDPRVWKPFSWYLFRPFLGMVTALAIFILAKAGQITISDMSISEGLKEDLNPFFISFLAIISGLLSEQAIERIRSAGSAIFRSEALDKQTGDAIDLQERWGIELNSKIKDQGKSIEELLEFVTGTVENVEDWIEERSPVPPREQRIISSWLSIPTRKLFTDLPPAPQ